jgi:acetyl-CoA acetyltransferase
MPLQNRCGTGAKGSDVMTLRGATAVVGIGHTPYYQRGESPESELALCVRAIVAACEDAGIDPRDVDGFVSYGADHNMGAKLMPALGTRELRTSILNWGGGGGGIPGCLNIAAAQILAGQAECVAVFRSLSEKSSGRLRVVVSEENQGPQYQVNGIGTPIQYIAFRAQRLLEAGVPRSAMEAIALADYYHANRNPEALARNVVLDSERYQRSKIISEPLRLFDCSRESDGGAAVIVMRADRAKDTRKTPAYILAAPISAAQSFGYVEENHGRGSGQPAENFEAWNFHTVAPRLWRESGYGPQDVDVAQLYEHVTAGAVAALIYHGFCTRESAGDFIRFENLIAPSGQLPINTSGGNLAEAFLHGMNLVLETVRQIRGESCNQVPGAKLSLMTGGPSVGLASSALLGSEETL